MAKKPADLLMTVIVEQMKVSNINQEDINALIREIPRKWEKHGDLVIFPQNTFKNDLWKLLGNKLFEGTCQVLKINRIARKNPVKSDVFRSSNVELLWGNNGVVLHTDNKIKYQWDVTKCMFSIGNITEKLRIASLNCENEVVVDLFAGIGYFVLPYLVHAKAKHVHACEINPNSVEALRKNLENNKVQERCTVYLGDNRTVCPTNIADRVNLGLIPSSKLSWETACCALKNDTGGVLHIHANIDSFTDKNWSVRMPFRYKEWEEWTNYAISKIKHILLQVKPNQFSVEFLHLEHVKSYAPHVDHLVLDLNCRPIN